MGKVRRLVGRTVVDGGLRRRFGWRVRGQHREFGRGRAGCIQPNFVEAWAFPEVNTFDALGVLRHRRLWGVRPLARLSPASVVFDDGADRGVLRRGRGPGTSGLQAATRGRIGLFCRGAGRVCIVRARQQSFQEVDSHYMELRFG